MEGNFGIAGFVLAILVLLILRGRYGRIASGKALLEELFTCVSLLGFTVAFALIVARSPEGRQRYKTDVEFSVPVPQGSAPASPETVKDRLGILAGARSDSCLACHALRSPDALRETAASISRDFEGNVNAYGAAAKPLRAQVAAQKMLIRSAAAVEAPQSGWRNWLFWLSKEGRQARKSAAKARLAECREQDLEKRIAALEAHYHFQEYRATVRQLLVGYSEASGTGDSAQAAHCLLQAASCNAKFYAAMAGSSKIQYEARSAIFMLRWGALVLVAASLITRSAIRRLCPEAAWFMFPGVATCWGMSICLLTDYSLNYLVKYRFLGLYAWAYILFCHFIITLVVLLFKSNHFQSVLTRFLSLLRIYWKRVFLALFLPVAGFCYLFRKQPQVSSELVKLYLVLFFAWYATFRGDYIAGRTRITGLVKSIFDKEWMCTNLLVFILFTGLGGGAFLSLKDFGPLLLILVLLTTYSWLIVGGDASILTAFGGGFLVAAGYALRGVLGRMSLFAHIYERFSEMVDPFHSGSGELAKLFWLRNSAGMTGYSFGRIPYFGHYVVRASDLQVTPAQLQSDYSSTHLIAQLGYPLGIVFLMLYFVWWLKIFIDSSRQATTGQGSEGSRFMGWFVSLGSLLLLIQGTLTTAGGFTVAPLTGITLPLISLGITSSVLSSIVLAAFYANEEVV